MMLFLIIASLLMVEQAVAYPCADLHVSPAACAKLDAAASVAIHAAQRMDADQREQEATAATPLPVARLLSSDGATSSSRNATAQPQPAAIRIFTEMQLPPGFPHLSFVQQVVQASISTLQGYLKVRHPVGTGGLLALPEWLDQDLCSEVQSNPGAWYGLTCDGPGWIPDFDPTLPSSDIKAPTCVVATLNASHTLSPDCHDRSGNITCHRSVTGAVGGEDTDLYLYVTADFASCGDATLAYSSACQMYDPLTHRPTVGMLNFCSAAFETDADSVLATVVHELVHTLGFALPQASQMYVDSRNRLLGQSNVLRVVPFTPPDYSGSADYGNSSGSAEGITGKSVDTPRSGYTMVITPRVVKEVRSQFNCSSLEGAALEDQGGAGAEATHWETELFQGELMTPTAPLDSAFEILSRITLALLEDTGWYVANYTASSHLPWGLNAGCGFARSTCATAGLPYFCDSGVASGAPLTGICTFDAGSRGECRANDFSNCGMVRTSAPTRRAGMRRPSCGSDTYYNDNALTDYAVGLAFGPGWELGRRSRCANITLPLATSSPLALELPVQTFNNSGSSNVADLTVVSSKGLCWDAKCNTAGTQLYYKMKGRWLQCPAGATLHLTQHLRSITAGSINCPQQPQAVCRSLLCPSWCNGQGARCFEGRCFCHLGYYGRGCHDSYLNA